MANQHKIIGLVGIGFTLITAGLFGTSRPASAAGLVHPIQIGQAFVGDHDGSFGGNDGYGGDHGREFQRQREERRQEFLREQRQHARREELRREEIRREFLAEHQDRHDHWDRHDDHRDWNGDSHDWHSDNR